MIRPASRSDLSDFLDLSALAGPGFTSLPVNEPLLAERLSASEKAFAGGPGTLTLALENRQSGHVVGCAAIKPAGQSRQDFLNFRITDHGETLSPTALYADLTEVGSLLLHPDYRRAGIGPWLARSRYLLIAADRPRFGEAIFSELRGVVDADDYSPFYDSVCAAFFDRSFAEADDLCARGRQAELNALLPATPIYLNDLTPRALEAIGRPHRDGTRALDYLADEGFRFEGVVDLLDGGPAVVARSDDVKTISTSLLASITSGDIAGGNSQPAYLALGEGPAFRCCRASVIQRNGSLICEANILEMLEARHGATVRACLTGKEAAPTRAANHPQAIPRLPPVKRLEICGQDTDPDWF